KLLRKVKGIVLTHGAHFNSSIATVGASQDKRRTPRLLQFVSETAGIAKEKCGVCRRRVSQTRPANRPIDPIARVWYRESNFCLASHVQKQLDRCDDGDAERLLQNQ